MPASGTISMDQVRSELGVTGPISFGDTFFRNLTEVDSGQISISAAYGKRTAKGGNIWTSGSYTFHSFPSSGVFKISGNTKQVEVLVVAGGGGGSESIYGGGGGGAGGVLYHPSYGAIGTLNAVVGAGGPKFQMGTNSTFGPLTAMGGGLGGGSQDGNSRAGGSGGGAGHMNPAGAASPSTQTSNNGGTGYGNPGGGSVYSGAYPHGSGGGAGGAGGVWANGGDGLSFPQFGVVVAGGGGQCTNSGSATAGGTGGGGSGANVAVAGSGAPNTGGGGGGARIYGGGSAGGGGSGLIILRYLT